MRLCSNLLLPALFILLSGCALFGPSVEEVAVHGDLHTIRFRPKSTSGSQFESYDDSYVKVVKAKASAICKGSKYEIVEHGAKPSTLFDKKDLDPRDHYFVIRCSVPR